MRIGVGTAQRRWWMLQVGEESRIIRSLKRFQGAGNAFLGGLAGGLALGKNLYDAVLYATVSASFTIEQYGLPPIGPGTLWNGDSPERRVEELQNRYRDIITE